MNYYVLSIDSLVTTFELIESYKPILFKLKSSLEDTKVFEKIKEKDIIFGYYIEPTDRILLMMQVEKVNSDSINLHKLFELSEGVDIQTIVSDASYSKLQTPSIFKNISEEEANEIKNELYLKMKTIIEIEDIENHFFKEKETRYRKEIELDDYIQKIYFGVPGTGKSYNVKKIIAENQLMDNDIDGKYKESIEIGHIDDEILNSEYIYRTTVYPDYSYHDFIGQIMPIIKKNNEEDIITYDFQPGIFTMALKQALTNTENRIYLIIEEMSRGDVAAIFGDIFQLLDRDDKGVSEYQIDNEIIYDYFEKNINNKDWKNILNEEGKIKLPNNFNIIGTINTSDQNVFVMDNAFKRRFEFEYVNIMPVKCKDGKYLNNFNIEFENNEEIEWIYLYQALNQYIVSKNGLNMPEDKQIGQFFIKFNNNDKKNYEQVTNKLLLYLWEDIHLVNISDINTIFKNDLNTNYDSFGKIYRDLCDKKNIFNEKIMEIYIDIKNNDEKIKGEE